MSPETLREHGHDSERGGETCEARYSRKGIECLNVMYMYLGSVLLRLTTQLEYKYMYE